MVKKAEKLIRVNETDETVPGTGEVPEATPGEALNVETASELIQKADVTDSKEDWDAVAEMLYNLERSITVHPGLHESRLGRILERLP